MPETQNSTQSAEQSRPQQLASSSQSLSSSGSSHGSEEDNKSHLEEGDYFYGGDDNHLFYKFRGHTSEGSPVNMKYAVIYDHLPHGYKRTETKMEQIGASKKTERKEKKKQRKMMKKQAREIQKEEAIHKLYQRLEEKEKRRIEFHNRVYHELQRREWERYYKRQQERQEKEEEKQKRHQKKEDRKLEKDKKHYQHYQHWACDQESESEEQGEDQYIQDRHQQDYKQQGTRSQYSPDAWQRRQSYYLDQQKLWAGPAPHSERKHAPPEELRFQRRPSTSEGERALFAKTDQARRNMKTVKEFMTIAYSLKKAQTKKDCLERLLTPNARFVSPGTFSEVRTCREYVDAHIVIMKCIPNLRICSFDFECQEGNKIALRYTAEGTHLGEAYRSTSNPDSDPIAPTHQHAVWSASALFELEEGKIKKFTKEWSKVTMFAQLGWPMEDCLPPPNIANRLREASGIETPQTIITEALKGKQNEKKEMEAKLIPILTSSPSMPSEKLSPNIDPSSPTSLSAAASR